MKLRNVLIVVDDTEKSKKYYHDLDRNYPIEILNKSLG